MLILKLGRPKFTKKGMTQPFLKLKSEIQSGGMIYDDGLKNAIPYALIPKKNQDVKNFTVERSGIERVFALVAGRFKFISTPHLVKTEKSIRMHSSHIVACFFFHTLDHEERNRLNIKRGLPKHESIIKAPEEYKLFNCKFYCILAFAEVFEVRARHQKTVLDDPGREAWC